MYKSYAGIGSRRAPADIIRLMEQFAEEAAALGWTLRSGAAAGADTAFETGCDRMQGSKEIYLPWQGFNRSTSTFYHPSDLARAKAATIHPAWKGLSRAAQLLQTRNMQQIFGQLMANPVAFVICWTPDGCESHRTYGRQTGGTGSAISAASQSDIPVYNMANEGSFRKALQHLIAHEGDQQPPLMQWN